MPVGTFATWGTITMTTSQVISASPLESAGVLVEIERVGQASLFQAIKKPKEGWTFDVRYISPDNTASAIATYLDWVSRYKNYETNELIVGKTTYHQHVIANLSAKVSSNAGEGTPRIIDMTIEFWRDFS